MKAIWKNNIVAESDDTIIIEGNHYFPPDAINSKFFKPTDTRTVCPWKGEASYFTLHADGQESKDAAWTYKTPKEMASQIKNYVAFWKDVEVKK